MLVYRQEVREMTLIKNEGDLQYQIKNVGGFDVIVIKLKGEKILAKRMATLYNEDIMNLKRAGFKEAF